MNVERCILHSDLNNFYASVALLTRPELRGFPIAVCGNFEDRHGVVLAKNLLAKQAGVKTGEPFFQAKRKCAGLIPVTADFPAYLRVSSAVREIYARFTDRIEPFGIDECWLDVTESLHLFGSGRQIADLIRETVKREIGVTVSVGVSWNKIFAKLGSDMKKPDAVTEITPENFQKTVWALPASDLLFVGKATAKKLALLGIATIGDLAKTDEGKLQRTLGKWGKVLYAYANGWDETPVSMAEEEREVKSIGNSLTFYRDLENEEDVKMLLFLLADSVAERLAESGLGRASTVKISFIDNEFHRYSKQGKPSRPVCSAKHMADFALSLFHSAYDWRLPIRAVGLTVCDFTESEQLSLFSDGDREDKELRVDSAVAGLKRKYGSHVVKRGVLLEDGHISEHDVAGGHIIHPNGKHGS